MSAGPGVQEFLARAAISSEGITIVLPDRKEIDADLVGVEMRRNGSGNGSVPSDELVIVPPRMLT